MPKLYCCKWCCCTVYFWKISYHPNLLHDAKISLIMRCNTTYMDAHWVFVYIIGPPPSSSSCLSVGFPGKETGAMLACRQKFTGYIFWYEKKMYTQYHGGQGRTIYKISCNIVWSEFFYFFNQIIRPPFGWRPLDSIVSFFRHPFSTLVPLVHSTTCGWFWVFLI